MYPLGLYEQLINQLILSKLKVLDRDIYYIKEIPVDKTEAARILSLYLGEIIRTSLSLITGEKSLEKQINLSNKIILLLKQELENAESEDDIISTEGKILTAVFKRINVGFSDFEKYIKKITPYRFSTFAFGLYNSFRKES